MSSIRCDIYDPKEYGIWFAATPYGAASKPAKTLKQWAAEEQADVVYNLCLFNMTGSGSDQYGVIKGRTLQYLRAKNVDCGYGGTAERLTVSPGNVVAGVKVAVQDGVVQPYADSPLDEEPLAETVYLDILSQAQRYVYIYTPYLAVGEEMLDALKNAAKRGVDVRLILPGIPDKKLVFRLSRSYYLPLLRAGVRIYEFTPGFLHAKCYVSDDRVAAVGSINMDYRSLFLHFECGTLLFHNSQIAALRKDVERTLPQCREIMRSDCRTNLPGTALDSLLRLLSPLM